MKRKRYSVEQIIAAVKLHESGTSVADIARKLGIAEQTFYRWKKQYGGLEPDQARELSQLRDENAKLKKLVADLSLDKVMLQDVIAKSGERVPAKARDALPCRALSDQCPACLRTGPDRQSNLLSEVSSAGQGCRLAREDPRSGSQPGALRLQAHPYPVAA